MHSQPVCTLTDAGRAALRACAALDQAADAAARDAVVRCATRP
ncbi:hypothetical protein [Cupriavidus alkaliphilus]|uniref:Uncharacterized protein n=1 Tax=Cupriavidus alkaliphilus TaxID=942866 RepID=A0A7W4V8C9_9BURK|nr:hypothetical protein [Cupriavidus alkaliphilus]MBB3006843.1 hypothetical protein [Cupriavidus alkaliphilus]